MPLERMNFRQFLVIGSCQLIRNACIDLGHDSLNSLRIRSQLIDQFKHSRRGIAGVRRQMLATAECAFAYPNYDSAQLPMSSHLIIGI